MGLDKYLRETIQQTLKNLHTAYLGKVLSVKGNTATVQPLGLTKAYGEKAKAQAIVSNIPIAFTKTKTEEITYMVSETKTETKTIIVPSTLARGDIVVCVVCDRDITEARKGNNALPPVGEHSLSDSVIVGCL